MEWDLLCLWVNFETRLSTRWQQYARIIQTDDFANEIAFAMMIDHLTTFSRRTSILLHNLITNLQDFKQPRFITCSYIYFK